MAENLCVFVGEEPDHVDRVGSGQRVPCLHLRPITCAEEIHYHAARMQREFDYTCRRPGVTKKAFPTFFVEMRTSRTFAIG